MNYSMIFYIIGWILDVEAALLVPSLAVSLIYHESCALAFFITIVLCLIPGVILVRKQPKNKVFYAREGSVTVALSWIVMSIMGSIPFLLSGSITNPVDLFHSYWDLLHVTIYERTGGFMRKMHGKEDRGIKYRERGSSPGRRKRGKTCHRWKCCLRDR